MGPKKKWEQMILFFTSGAICSRYNGKSFDLDAVTYRNNYLLDHHGGR
jgi:hypothetical protein